MRSQAVLSTIVTLALTCAAAAESVMVPSLPFRPPAQDEVLAAYMQAMLQDQSLTAEQRTAVLKELTAAEKDGAAEHAITHALIAVHPEFGKALSDLADEKLDAAMPALKEMSQSKDAYLAAHAEYYLARAYFQLERFEDALPLLHKLAGPDKANLTMHAGEALFYKGICHNFLIERVEAMQSLATFLEQNGKAPERLLVGARHLLDELALLDEGSLWDVEQRMDFSRRHLDLEWSGDPTQKQQQTIIAMIDKLIEEAEEKEKSGGT